MLSLFKIEWMKVKTYRAFWVLLGIFIVLYPATLYSASRIFIGTSSLEGEMVKNLIGNPLVFPRVWITSSYIGGSFFIIIGMLFILLVTNETQYRTHRQNIIDGWSRSDFLKAKLAMALFFVIGATVIVALCGLWIGLLYSPASLSPTNGLHFLLYFMINAAMYLMIAMLISILIKRTGLAIIIYFAFICFDNVIWAFCFNQNLSITYFMPLESADSLISNPFRDSILDKRTIKDSTLVIISLSYLVLIGGFINYYFNKIDLKN